MDQLKVAFVFFPNFTLLDVVGVYDPLHRLRTLGIMPGLTIDYCAFHQACHDQHGWPAPPLQRVASLSDYDLLFIPGGFGTRPLRYDKPFTSWLRTAAQVPLITSVCTGSLLLGAAGLLDGHRATTHFSEYDALKAFIPSVEREELVDDGTVITAGAVAASIPLGLYLCERLAGPAARERVRLSMNYPL